MSDLKILVLGNDPQINAIDFSKISPKVITLGVNRIWLKHIPNYFFFNDAVVLDELNKKPDHLEQIINKSISFSSDWVSRKRKQEDFPQWLTIYPRRLATRFPDSVTTAIQLFTHHYFEARRCTFYIAGVSLTWKEPSHFWKQMNYSSKNNHDKDWYRPRFAAILKNFHDLKKFRYKMISVTQESLLNGILRYEHIGNLYSK